MLSDSCDWYWESGRARLADPQEPMADPTPTHVLRFGVFELDTHSGELRRHDLKVRCPDQSLQILKELLRRPAELVEFAVVGRYPAFKTIASEPRFRAVMRQVGLPH